MNFNLLIPFFFGMVLLAASPGPGVLGSMARAISDGFKSSLYFIGGLVAGDIIFMILAVFGLSAIAKIAEGVFLIVRIVGGLYLIYLGVEIFREVQSLTNVEAKKTSGQFQTFTSGFLVTMGNPKPILFYASVLPTLINFNDVRPLDVLIMAMIIAIVSFSVLGTYSYIASLSHRISMSALWQKRVNQAAGIVMIVVGILILIP
jgi:threonine/homoserine/homoserine lactone efflux protein